MFKRTLLVLITLLISQVSFAAERPSPEIIKEFFEVTNAQQTFEMSLAPFKKIMIDQMNASYKQIRVKYGTNEQDEIIKKKFGDINNYINGQVAWLSLEPMVTSAYQEELTQKQLEEIIAFYKTDSGKAMLSKVPNIFKRVTESMGPIQKNISTYVTEALKQLGKELDDSSAQKK